MGKFRLTFLSFLINIVIFTSSLSFDGLSKNEASEAYEKLTNGDLDLSKYDEELVQNEISFDEIKPHSSRNKSRRDLPYSYEQPETNNNDADYKDSAFNDDDIRYILNRIKTSRDINARTAKSTTDTFNGKLIHVLFIDFHFLPCSRTPETKSKIYCFVLTKKNVFFCSRDHR